MKKLLITGFDPFGGASVNPAREAVMALPDVVGDYALTKLEIPTVFGLAAETVLRAAEALCPDVILCVGQAGGRAAITPEVVAINLREASIPDNEGNQPIDEPIFADGDAAYFSNLPVKAMVQEIKNAGYPTSLSNTAGTYICNHVMYGILYYIQKEFPNVRGGFIHVPYACEQNHPSQPSLPLNLIAKGLEYSIEACLEHQNDLSLAAGCTH